MFPFESLLTTAHCRRSLAAVSSRIENGLTKLLVVSALIFSAPSTAVAGCALENLTALRDARQNELTELFNHPAVRDNEAFWRDLGRLGENPPDRQVRRLLEQYGATDRRVASGDSVAPAVERRAATPTTTTTSTPRYTLSGQAERDMRNINRLSDARVRRHVDEFMEIASGGFQSVRNAVSTHPGWLFKRMQGDMHAYYEVRMSQGYRVVFREEADGSVLIRNIDNSTTH